MFIYITRPCQDKAYGISFGTARERREHHGVIRRIIRGIYDYTRHSRALGGPTSPNIDQIAHALARKFGWRIQPDGAAAQNLLGLSTQVPARAVYSPMVITQIRMQFDATLRQRILL